MTYRGKIKNGRVTLDDPNALPEGTEVEVRPVKKSQKRKTPQKGRKAPVQNLAERLAAFIGTVKDLPPDMSVNLDHYLYGHPKRA